MNYEYKVMNKKAQVIVYLIIKYEISKKYSNKYDNITYKNA